MRPPYYGYSRMLMDIGSQAMPCREASRMRLVAMRKEDVG